MHSPGQQVEWAEGRTPFLNRGAAIEAKTIHDSDDHKADFAEFCGGWSEADAAEFDENTKDLREIDPRDWE